MSALPLSSYLQRYDHSVKVDNTCRHGVVQATNAGAEPEWGWTFSVFVLCFCSDVCISLQAHLNWLYQFNYVHLGGVGGEESESIDRLYMYAHLDYTWISTLYYIALKPASMNAFSFQSWEFHLPSQERMDYISGECNWSLDLAMTMEQS